MVPGFLPTETAAGLIDPFGLEACEKVAPNQWICDSGERVYAENYSPSGQASFFDSTNNNAQFASCYTQCRGNSEAPQSIAIACAATSALVGTKSTPWGYAAGGVCELASTHTYCMNKCANECE